MITDRMRAINQNDNEIVEKLRSYPYAKNSIILDIATNMHAMPDEVRFGGGFQIDSFVGIDDRNKQKGGDYFEITPLEDYIAKLVMTNEGMIILPTMADKKTWYAIKHDRLKGRMVFDLITNIKTS